MKLFTVTERKKILQDELYRIVDLIKKEYDPLKIILFGSLANNEIHEWSDIDILIIKETHKRPIDRYLELCRLAKPKVGIDFFVYTPKEYEILLKEKYSFLLNILENGKVLYEKRSRRVV